jgi:hypothetical protein
VTSVEEFDQQIAAVQRQISDEIIPALAKAREDWLDAAAPWLAKAWVDAARETSVTREPERTAALPQAAVDEMRAEVESLAAGARRQIEAVAVEQNRVWPDLSGELTDKTISGFTGSPFSPQHGSRGGHGAPRALEKQNSRLVAMVAEILRSYGYERIEFPDPSWPDSVAKPMERYAEWYRRWVEADRRLARLETEKKQFIAAQKWGN